MCSCKECFIEITKYKCTGKYKKDYLKYNKRKAGILIQDVDNRLLLVQSRGHLWGIPKGSIEVNESFKQGALRELEEETGIKLNIQDLNIELKLNAKVMYYFVKIDNRIDVSVQKNKGNDANSVSWINLDCLIKQITNSKIKITFHKKNILNRIFEINFFKL